MSTYKETRDKAAEEHSTHKLDCTCKGNFKNETQFRSFQAGYDAGFTAPEVLALVTSLEALIAECNHHIDTLGEEGVRVLISNSESALSNLQAYQAAKEESGK